jgi:hypothetical protein
MSLRIRPCFTSTSSATCGDTVFCCIPSRDGHSVQHLGPLLAQGCPGRGSLECIRNPGFCLALLQPWQIGLATVWPCRCLAMPPRPGGGITSAPLRLDAFCNPRCKGRRTLEASSPLLASSGVQGMVESASCASSQVDAPL